GGGAKARASGEGVERIYFGKGDPREPTDPMIRRALAESITEISTYPLAEGLPELRAAVAAWCARRFGVELDPDTEVIPTYGSKEAIFLLAQILIDRDGDRRLVVTTQPGYPVPDRGAAFAGPRSCSCRCSKRTASCRISTLSTPRRGSARRSCGSTIRTTRPERSRRSTSSSAWPTSPPSTVSCWRRTRRTPSSGSTWLRIPR